MSSEMSRDAHISSRTWAETAARSAIASAVTAALGIVFLGAMFASFAVHATSLGMALGWVNDVLVMASYLFAAPVVIAVHGLFPVRHRMVDLAVGALGIGSIAAITVLQWLLVSGSIAFDQEVGPVSIAILGFGVWLVAAGAARGRAGAWTRGGWMGLLGATYVGYPFWALWMARRLRSGGSAGEE